MELILMAGIKRRAHGEGHIYQRKDGRYEGKVTITIDSETGKQKFKSVYGKSRKEVAEKMAELLSQKREFGFIETKKILFKEWLDRWLNDYMKMTLRPTTWALYETISRVHIVPLLGDIPLTKLKSADFQRLYTQKMESGRVRNKTDEEGKIIKKGLSARTIRQIHNVIRSSLSQAVEEGLLTRNPSETVKLPRVEHFEVEPFSMEEVKKILIETQKDRYKAAYILELHTGMRRGELLGLRWADVDFLEELINVNRSLGVVSGKIILLEPKTAKGKRKVEVAKNVLDELKQHKIRQNSERLEIGELWQNNDLIFCQEDGSPINPNSFRRRFARLLERIGLPAKRFHDLRHTFASILLSEGEDIKRIQDMLGHANPRITLETYSHVMPGKKRETANKISSIISSL